MTNWTEIREKFPALKNCTYLNTAGGCALSDYAAAEGKRYFDEMHQRGDALWSEWLSRTEGVRASFARLINAEAEEIAFVQNASLAMNYANDLMQQGGVILAREDFPTVTLPWIHGGRVVEFLEPGEDGRIELRRESDSTTCLAIGHVNYSTGFKFDLAEVSEFCEQNSLQSVIDATQSFGAIAIDVKKTPIDCLLLSGYKWSTAGYGIGVMFLRKDILKKEKLPAVGWRSAEIPYKMLYDRLELSSSASALELGHPPFPGIFALGGALKLISEIGVEAIEARIYELSDYMHQRLDAEELEIASCRERPGRSGITMVRVDSPDEVVEALKKRNVFVSVRGGLIRVSAHFYNTEADIDRFVSELKDIV